MFSTYNEIPENVLARYPTHQAAGVQPWTDAQILAQMKSGQSWGGASISYGFPTIASQMVAEDGERDGFVALNSAQQSAARLAILTWADLIRPALTESADGAANITFGLTNTGIEFAHAYYPTDGSAWFNSTEPDLVNPVTGGYGFNTYMHEIGHTLGLNHMGEYDGAQVDQPSCWQDSSLYSIMSYFGPSNNSGGQGQVAWADWIGSGGVEYSPQTPMINDVMAIQSVYGAATTRAENTVYGFDTSITGRLAEIYNFSQNLNPILCIYDSGGIDTLNLSGYSTNSMVDLIGGVDHFSSCNGMTSNIQIARGVIIENAATGSGADTLIGNSEANVLSSGAGDDILHGGGGNDQLNGGAGLNRVVEEGLRADYQILSVGNDTFTVTDTATTRDGTDTLHQVQRIQFADTMLALDIAGTAGQAYRMYQAAFDRVPDKPGLGYWIDEMDNGSQLKRVGDSFVVSPEFISKYGANSSNAEFVGLLYEHVLHRPLDQPGFEYWNADLNSGISRGAVLASFAQSPENQAQTLPLIANGIEYQAWLG